MGTTLKQGAVLTDVLGAVRSRTDYLERVFKNMEACKKAHGSAYVTIALTSEGGVPPYRVTPTPPSEFSWVYDGVTHAPLEERRLQELREGDWSDASMSYGEVWERLLNSRGRSRPITNPRRGSRWYRL